MKKIVGLDPGTNSIGWSVVDMDEKRILGAGSRIIPMDQGVMGAFETGNTISQTSKRTMSRLARRRHERFILRRQRLNRVLSTLGFLPDHYESQLDRYGNFLKGKEPKLAWREGQAEIPEFLFTSSFEEMLEDFRKTQPDLLANDKKIPYDWTLYYLRKKALTQPISKQELAWVLLSFNQKRGYRQIRGEEEEVKSNKREEYYSLKVVSVEDTGERDKKNNGTWYKVTFENGMVYPRTSRYPLDWVGKTKDIIVTTTLNPDGSIKLKKDGTEDRSFRVPKEDDWGLKKIKTEHTIDQSGQMVGEYIYNTLLQTPSQKIIGGLVRTIERKYYKAEIAAILNKQREFIPELKDNALYQKCIEVLYPTNVAYRNSIAKRDFLYLFIDDIIFYQRPLKSKKGLIDNCPYERYHHKDTDVYTPVKCVAKSHPLFQEFRLWQFLGYLRIYQRTAEIDGKLVTDYDVTQEFLPDTEAITDLFDWMNSREGVSQKDFLSYPPFKLKKADQAKYRWNYVEDRIYPCNKTRTIILKGLNKYGLTEDFLTKEELERIWHILYSISVKEELKKAFLSYANKKNERDIEAKKQPQIADVESFASIMGDIKPFDEEGYASYSAKAISKLLPLLRIGKYWSAGAIDAKTQRRIDKIINGEVEDNISPRVREKLASLEDISQCQGLPVWAACYLVYGHHSEAKDASMWECPEDIDVYLRSFRQHSLRNPIVEQVVLETLRVVRDIWRQYGKIDEIHLEIGRDLKRTNEERERISRHNKENEDTNLRIKALLAEFINPDYEIDNVRPQSPSQQELLKNYEEGVRDANPDMPDDIDTIFKGLSNPASLPSRSDIIRYKCWLDQKYRSPYTGNPIPLAKLFTEEYQIEHVIPQSRYFDDSLSNKVICESEVNQLKDRMLGFEFIKQCKGQVVQLSKGGTVKILSPEEYQRLVGQLFARNHAKLRKLLLEDIPEQFIERQMNDSRYISRFLTSVLSHVVRHKDSDGKVETEATSKNVIVCSGSVTDILKRDWGVGDVWNRLILTRFQRLNQLTGTNDFTTVTARGHEIPRMPLILQRGFNKKRIDHRHHAMDAIVIACCTRDHVNLINNEAARASNRAARCDLMHKLRRYEDCIINGKKCSVAKEFIKPWDSFTQDLEKTLSGIVVSFKQNLRVINKATNYYTSFHDEDGNLRTSSNGMPKKGNTKQVKGDSWAIRKPLHKETVYGEVNLKLKKTVKLKEAVENPSMIVDSEIRAAILQLLKNGKNLEQIQQFFNTNQDVWADVINGKIEFYYFSKDAGEHHYATRYGNDLVSLLGSSNVKNVQTIIDSIADTGIQKILREHLKDEGNDPQLAFSADGVERMNSKILSLNNGKPHQPIYKVRTQTKGDLMFPIGTTGINSKKFVTAAQGTNLYFVIYKTAKSDGRKYATIPLNLIIDCQKHYGKEWRLCLSDYLTPQEAAYLPADATILYILSPNDLVYVPTPQQIKDGITNYLPSRIYKAVSFDKGNAYFVPATTALAIFSIKNDDQKKSFGSIIYPIQNEYGLNTPKSKTQKTTTDEIIKEICFPIKVDRLGNIIKQE